LPVLLELEDEKEAIAILSRTYTNWNKFSEMVEKALQPFTKPLKTHAKLNSTVGESERAVKEAHSKATTTRKVAPRPNAFLRN
jgi:hypothetical protein